MMSKITESDWEDSQEVSRGQEIVGAVSGIGRERIIFYVTKKYVIVLLLGVFNLLYW